MDYIKNCTFDLWSPGLQSHLENNAFTGYASHEQEKEDVINMIVAAARTNQSDMTIYLRDYFTASEAEYIRKEVERRLNS